MSVKLLNEHHLELLSLINAAQARSAVGNVSGNKCESDCRSRGREIDPAWSHTFVEIDHEIISTVILFQLNHSRRSKYWLTACSSLPMIKCG